MVVDETPNLQCLEECNIALVLSQYEVLVTVHLLQANLVSQCDPSQFCY